MFKFYALNRMYPNPDKGIQAQRPRGTFNRGMMLFVIIAVVLVVSILAFSLQKMANQSLRQSRKLRDIHITTLLVHSGISCAIGRIQEELEIPGSKLNSLLLSEDLAIGTDIPFNTDPFQALAENFKGSVVKVNAKIGSISPLDQARLNTKTGGGDPAERKCGLIISATASYRGSQRSLIEHRELRVVNLVPGILGKFSLFVRKVDRDPLGYNRYANNINGFPDDRVSPSDRYLPMVFKNGGELDAGVLEKEDPDSYLKRGYIYLGGGQVALNLTAGNDEAFGENFHFFSLHSAPSIPGYYDYDPPSFFTRPPDFETTHPQSLNPVPPFSSAFAYCLKYVVSGFFSADMDGFNMNQDDRLAVTFPGAKIVSDPRMRSSILHLFGTRSNPSPTLVLGDVRRRFVEYAGVVIDTTHNGVRDGIVTYLKQTGKDFESLAAIPAETPSIGSDLPAGTKIKLDPNFSYKFMFGSDGVYKQKMCRLVENEPYLRSHDFLYFCSPGRFEPTESRFGEKTKLASFQLTFKLPFHPNMKRKTPFFDEGDLANFPPDFAKAKAIYRVADIETFVSRFMQNRKRSLVLDAPVIITGEKGAILKLPPELVVEKGGMIILENGTLSVGKITIDRNNNPEQILSCIALNGNIELDLSRSGAIEAVLIALNGRLVNTTPTRPIDLHGGFSVGELSPETFKAGGRIVYDSRFDPSGFDYRMYYRAYFSDIPTTVEDET